jgi:hypothetical protein
MLYDLTMSRDNALDKAAGYGLDGLGIRVRVPGGVRFLRAVQTGSNAHLDYLMRTGDYFPGSKVTGMWSKPLTSNYNRGQ